MTTTTQIPPKMKINKDIISAFVFVLIVAVFSLFVGITFKENSENELNEIKKVLNNQEAEKKNSEQREHVANFKRDSALSLLGTQKNEMFRLQSQFTSLNNNVLNLRGVFDKNLTELKNIQNEKDHVIDASLSEQYDFLSAYRYREYSGSTNP